LSFPDKAPRALTRCPTGRPGRAAALLIGPGLDYFNVPSTREPERAKDMQAKDVYFILHIPKCAGRTVQHFLTSNFAEKPSGLLNRDAGATHPESRILIPARRKAPYRYLGKRYEQIAPGSLDSIDFVFGFYLSKSMKADFVNRNVKQAVLVRDPVSHFYSHYNFRMAKYAAQGMTPFSFDLWYKSRRPNPISKYLFSYLEIPYRTHIFLSDQAKLNLILQGLSEFWHVGTHEECDKLIERIAEEQGVPPAFENRNVTQKKFMEFDEFKRSYEMKIREENGLDQAIFDYFSSKIPLEKRERPKVGGREWQNILRGGLVPWYIFRYRLKRRSKT